MNFLQLWKEQIKRNQDQLLVVHPVRVGIQWTSVDLYENRHDDVYSAHGTTVESSHPVHTTLTKARSSYNKNLIPKTSDLNDWHFLIILLYI